MKREHRRLSLDNAAADADAQLRRRLQRAADAEQRAERIEQASKAEVKRLTAHLSKWKEENVSIATDYAVSEPVPVPNGTHISPSLDLLECPIFIPPALPYPDVFRRSGEFGVNKAQFLAFFLPSRLSLGRGCEPFGSSGVQHRNVDALELAAEGTAPLLLSEQC